MLNLQRKEKNDPNQKGTEKDSEIAGPSKKKEAEPKAKGKVEENQKWRSRSR